MPLISKLAEHLRKPAGGIGGFIVKQFLKSKERALFLQAVVDHCNIKPNEHVLELGFGPGVALKYAAEKLNEGGGKLYGIDFSLEMMTEAMTLLKPEIIAGKVQLTVGDAADLPYRDDAIDTVFHANCYYYWDDHSKILQGIHRVLKPNGMMVTGLNLTAIKRAERRGFVTKEMIDVDQYMVRLKSNNFSRVEMKEYPFKGSENTYQIVFASKQI